MTTPYEATIRPAAGPVLRFAAAAAAALALAGCATLDLLTYAKDDASGVGGQNYARVFLLDPVAGAADARPAAASKEALDRTIRALAAAAGAHGEAFLTQVAACRPRISDAPGDPVSVGALASPLLFAGEKLIDFAVSQLQAKAERIAKRSRSVYAIPQVFVDAGAFAARRQCLVIVRGAYDDATQKLDLGLLAVVDVVPELGEGGAPAAFRTAFRLLLLNSAVAETRDGAPLSVSLGLVFNQAWVDRGQPRVATFAEASTTYRRVAFGAPQLSAEDARRSNLLAAPHRAAERLEIVVGVAETGSGAPDKNAVAAETSALGAAAKARLRAAVAAAAAR